MWKRNVCLGITAWGGIKTGWHNKPPPQTELSPVWSGCPALSSSAKKLRNLTFTRQYRAVSVQVLVELLTPLVYTSTYIFCFFLIICIIWCEHLTFFTVLFIWSLYGFTDRERGVTCSQTPQAGTQTQGLCSEDKVTACGTPTLPTELTYILFKAKMFVQHFELFLITNMQKKSGSTSQTGTDTDLSVWHPW